jgi:hypothetical protein
MNKKQHHERIKELSDLGERRAREAGVSGAVDLNLYLNQEELRQLSESLRSVDWRDPLPLPDHVSLDQVRRSAT